MNFFLNRCFCKGGLHNQSSELKVALKLLYKDDVLVTGTLNFVKKIEIKMQPIRICWEWVWSFT